MVDTVVASAIIGGLTGFGIVSAFTLGFWCGRSSNKIYEVDDIIDEVKPKKKAKRIPIKLDLANDVIVPDPVDPRAESRKDKYSSLG